MSYCQIITFTRNQPKRGIVYQNAWGGAARIWTALFDKYLKDPNIKYHSWLTGGEKLWGLAKDDKLIMFERAVHASTFDHAYISKANFKQFCTALRHFAKVYPPGECVDHLPAWADAIDKLKCQAVGFYGTSVSENPWFGYDEKKDKEIPVTLSKGFEVYEYIKS